METWEALTQLTLLSDREPVSELSSHLPLQVSEAGGSLLLKLPHASADIAPPHITDLTESLSLNTHTIWTLRSLKDSAEGALSGKTTFKS